MKQVSLAGFFSYCNKYGLPVAFYRLPGKETIHVIAQKSTKPVTFSAKKGTSLPGFVFAPFHEHKDMPNLLIKADIQATANRLPPLTFAENGSQKVTSYNYHFKAASRKEFMQRVQEITEQIQRKKFSKVVAARVVKEATPEKFSAAAFFKKLCRTYPHAFVSLVYTPQFGLWIGASPEVLLQADKKGVITYSLAGTQPLTKSNKKVSWGEKEKNEQDVVSRYILSKLNGIMPSPANVTGPATVKAGNLLHLRTSFFYRVAGRNLVWKAVKKLHPTPAVAGIKRKQAIDHILKNEKSERAFYSGYLGPANIKGESHLFVNLRCMHVTGKHLFVFAGCGITAQSVPAKEWDETTYKSQTLLAIVNSLYPSTKAKL